MSERCYDKRGVPIYPGDLIRSPHFRDRQGKLHYLYHTAVLTQRGLEMVPTSHLESTKVSGGGRCMLSQDIVRNAQVIAGHGPGEYLDFDDRPKRRPVKTEEPAHAD